MLSPEYHIILPILLTLLMSIALLWDAASFRIPNWVNGLILLLYPLSYLLFDMQANWIMALAGFGIVFALGYIIFIFNIMGGGDVKMLAVCGLWLEWSMALVHFILGVAILGGILSLLLLAGRPTIAFLASRLKNTPKIPRVLSYGEPIPYGIAIGATFIIMTWKDLIPSLRYAG